MKKEIVRIKKNKKNYELDEIKNEQLLFELYFGLH